MKWFLTALIMLPSHFYILPQTIYFISMKWNEIKSSTAFKYLQMKNYLQLLVLYIFLYKWFISFRWASSSNANQRLWLNEKKSIFILVSPFDDFGFVSWIDILISQIIFRVNKDSIWTITNFLLWDLGNKKYETIAPLLYKGRDNNELVLK